MKKEELEIEIKILKETNKDLIYAYNELQNDFQKYIKLNIIGWGILFILNMIRIILK